MSISAAQSGARISTEPESAEVSSDLLQALRRRSQGPHGYDRPSGDERISEGGGHGTNARGTGERGSTGDRRLGSDGIPPSRRAAVRIEGGPEGSRILRLLVGNPLIMSQMAKHVPDAAAYAPVTILVVEGSDGVRLSYDTMASLLSAYGSQEALKVAEDLDAKVEGLMTAAAS